MKGTSFLLFLVKGTSFLHFLVYRIAPAPPPPPPPSLLKPKVWDAGWVFWENLFGFVIRASRSTFLSGAIFEFLKSQFWCFLRVCMEIGHLRGWNYGMSDDVIRMKLCFSSVLIHGLSFYWRRFLNFAQKIFSIFWIYIFDCEHQ